MEEQFEKLLSETQNMILRILKENFTLSEISDFVGLSQEEVIKTVKVIADKRKLFLKMFNKKRRQYLLPPFFCVLTRCNRYGGKPGCVF